MYIMNVMLGELILGHFADSLATLLVSYLCLIIMALSQSVFVSLPYFSRVTPSYVSYFTLGRSPEVNSWELL